MKKAILICAGCLALIVAGTATTFSLYQTSINDVASGTIKARSYKASSIKTDSNKETGYLGNQTIYAGGSASYGFFISTNGESYKYAVHILVSNFGDLVPSITNGTTTYSNYTLEDGVAHFEINNAFKSGSNSSLLYKVVFTAPSGSDVKVEKNSVKISVYTIASEDVKSYTLLYFADTTYTGNSAASTLDFASFRLNWQSDASVTDTTASVYKQEQYSDENKKVGSATVSQDSNNSYFISAIPDMGTGLVKQAGISFNIPQYVQNLEDTTLHIYYKKGSTNFKYSNFVSTWLATANTFFKNVILDTSKEDLNLNNNDSNINGDLIIDNAGTVNMNNYITVTGDVKISCDTFDMNKATVNGGLDVTTTGDCSFDGYSNVGGDVKETANITCGGKLDVKNMTFHGEANLTSENVYISSYSNFEGVLNIKSDTGSAYTGVNISTGNFKDDVNIDTKGYVYTDSYAAFDKNLNITAENAVFLKNNSVNGNLNINTSSSGTLMDMNVQGITNVTNSSEDGIRILGTSSNYKGLVTLSSLGDINIVTAYFQNGLTVEHSNSTNLYQTTVAGSDLIISANNGIFFGAGTYNKTSYQVSSMDSNYDLIYNLPDIENKTVYLDFTGTLASNLKNSTVNIHIKTSENYALNIETSDKTYTDVTEIKGVKPTTGSANIIDIILKTPYSYTQNFFKLNVVADL